MNDFCTKLCCVIVQEIHLCTVVYKTVFPIRTLDSDSIRLVDPYPDSDSRSRRAKMTHKNREKFRNFMF